MVPKKRLYISHSLGDSGTESFECESTGSAHSSASSAGGSSAAVLHHHSLQHTPLQPIHHHRPSVSSDDLAQPQNLSLKKPDRESRDSRDSANSGFEVPQINSVSTTTNAASVSNGGQQPLQLAKVEPKEELLERPTSRMTPTSYWDPRIHALMDSSPIKLGHAVAAVGGGSPAASRLSLDSDTSGSSSYLMSYQFQEKVEAELANLYKNAAAASSGGGSGGLSAAADSATPISIRSFCIQDGNTYRCKVCNNAYTHPSNFHRHYVTTHLQRKSYPCTVCQKKFNRKDNMTAHLRAVHGWGGGPSPTSSTSSPEVGLTTTDMVVSMSGAAASAASAPASDLLTSTHGLQDALTTSQPITPVN